MNILLLSAYNTPSHNYWCNQLIKGFPEFNWTLLTLPPRKFSWRIRGNPLSWHSSSREALLNKYDTVIATSMVDFSTLIGLYPNLGESKKIIYFHENQFEFPLSANNSHTNVESMMVNLYGALCSDRVVFNSDYNRDSFFSGAENLLKRINDHSPVTVLDDIKNRCEVLPVPICNAESDSGKKIKNSIIWNHRWEFDKNPEDYYRALKILKEKGINFKLIMMGIQFKNSPNAFNKIKNEFSDNIICWGEQKKADYHSWLKKGEFIISTAIHEFQGLAVMEGVQMGARPVVPNRLSYPQWFNKEFLYGNSSEELAEYLEHSFQKKGKTQNLSQLTWNSLKGRYSDLIY